METDSGTRVNILSSKTRVAPLSSTQTIPRLELLSAVLLARLIKTVSSALESEISWESITCYTDSRVALAWIRGVTKQWKQFVENRVIEIRRLTPTSAWNHCPGKENPADLPSRGLDPEELRRNTLWWSGPAWLTTGEPTNLPALEGDPLECLSELKGPVVPMLLVSEGQTTSRMKISNIIEARKFTSLSRLYRVTANVLKFVRRSKKITVSTIEKYEGRKEAGKVWLHDCQSYLSQEPNYQTWQTQFGFFKDDSDLIRCGGRLENADIPFETKHPLMLSPHHPLCELIIKECHEKVKHNGVRETLAQFRSKFWVVRARSLIRKVIYQCVDCRKLEGQSYGMPPPPPLPHYRVNEAQPFQHTGLDFAGPLFIRAGNKESEKVWICLYTCCVTRAIHLDLVVDLHTGTFLNCFRRFVGRRGLPMHLVSDNGKTFKAAAAIIKKIWTNPDVQTHFAGMCVKWTFNLERAPWWGGFFERMVKSVKRCLRKTLGNSCLTYDELLTALIEVEAVINSRPLTIVSSSDTEEPLTPSHLLTGHRILTLPFIHSPPDQDFNPSAQGINFNKRMGHLRKVLDRFWKRWQAEYLVELRECHRHHGNRSKNTSHPHIGDVVLVQEQDRPRGLWKLAVVKEVMVGSDGHTRGAIVRVHDKSGRIISLRRSVRQLYALEPRIEENASEDLASVPVTTDPSTTVKTPGNRTRRAAAIRAIQTVHERLNELESEEDD